MSQQNPPKQDLYRMYHQLTQQANAIFEQESQEKVALQQQNQMLRNELIETKKLLEKPTPKEVKEKK